jgi:LysR family glycine cleavage system transcriptional activator
MARRMPSLTALRAFEAAARHVSFRAAAEELNVTHSAISHQVKELERELGSALFWRKGRSVELTEAGRDYLPILRQAFEQIALGADQVRHLALAGDLTLQVYVTFAVRWLIPRLQGFHQSYPDIHVRLSTSFLDWDFDPERGDVGIIYCENESTKRADWHYHHLFDAVMFPVCCPALALAGMGLRQPAELVNQVLLQVYPALIDWRDWLTAAGVPELLRRSGPAFDSYLLALEAAAEGQGVAMAISPLVASDLRAGRLIRPFDLAVPQPGSWHLICRKERRDDPRIASFRRWLDQELAQDPAISAAQAAR